MKKQFVESREQFLHKYLSNPLIHDLCWIIHDNVLFLRPYTMFELPNQNVSIGYIVPRYGVNNYCALCTVKAKKRTQTYNKEICGVS